MATSFGAKILAKKRRHVASGAFDSFVIKSVMVTWSMWMGSYPHQERKGQDLVDGRWRTSR